MKTVTIKLKNVVIDGSRIYETKNKCLFKALRACGVANCPTIGVVSSPIEVYVELEMVHHNTISVWHPYRLGIGGKIVKIIIIVDEF